MGNNSSASTSYASSGIIKPEPGYVHLGGNGQYAIRLYESMLTASLRGLLVSPQEDKIRHISHYFGIHTGLAHPANSLRVTLCPMTRPVIASYPDPEVIRSNHHTAATFGEPVYTKIGHREEILSLPILNYTSIDEIPKPTNNAVILRELPTRVIAVTEFAGVYSYEVAHHVLDLFVNSLIDDQLVTEGDTLEWYAVQYDGVEVPIHVRRNEVWVVLQLQNSIVRAMLAAGEGTTRSPSSPPPPPLRTLPSPVQAPPRSYYSPNNR